MKTKKCLRCGQPFEWDAPMYQFCNDCLADLEEAGEDIDQAETRYKSSIYTVHIDDDQYSSINAKNMAQAMQQVADRLIVNGKEHAQKVTIELA